MRLPRLYIDTPLIVDQEIILPKESSHYLLNVLRRNKDTEVTLFNGCGGEYTANLITTKNAQLQIKEYNPIERESNLQLTLVQAISRPERMDYTIQKAVELGVQHIVPVISERSPPLAKNKISKREQHWRKIIISAAEQCGRNHLPLLHEVFHLHHWLAKEPVKENCIVLSPTGKNRLTETIKFDQPITALVGAEGGLSKTEIHQAVQANYQEVQLGIRTLRTETAAVTILAVCQALWGDLING